MSRDLCEELIDLRLHRCHGVLIGGNRLRPYRHVDLLHLSGLGLLRGSFPEREPGLGIDQPRLLLRKHLLIGGELLLQLEKTGRLWGDVDRGRRSGTIGRLPAASNSANTSSVDFELSEAQQRADANAKARSAKIPRDAFHDSLPRDVDIMSPDRGLLKSL